MGNRMSSLPIVQYCSAAGVLGEKHGAGRAAAVSTAFHALHGEGGEAAHDQFERLTPSEQQELLSWKAPEPFEIDGTTLNYDDAFTEREVSLYDDGPEPISVGHLDMGWVVESAFGFKRVAVVGDIKRSEWSSPDGPTSLQMEAYGMALADEEDCAAYVCGHWTAVTGEWSWGPVRDVFGMEVLALWNRLRASAMNTSGEYCTGPHCDACWERLHCQEWLLPVQDPESALAPFAGPGGLTKDNALDCVNLYTRVKKLMDPIKKTLYAYVDREGGVLDGEGKIWKKVGGGETTTFDKNKLAAEYPEIYKACLKTVPRAAGCKWVKV